MVCAHRLVTYSGCIPCFGHHTKQILNLILKIMNGWMDGWSKVEIIFGVFIFAFIRSLTREVGSSPRRGAADGGRGSRAGTHCVVLHLKITTKHNHEAFRKVTLQQLLSSAVFQSILLRTSVFM